MEPAFGPWHMACAESPLLLDADEVLDLASEHEVVKLDSEEEAKQEQKPVLKSGAAAAAAIVAAKADAAELKQRR